MAKLLISCDNALYYYNGNYYYKDLDWKKFYCRYLRVFDKIRIANRVVKEEQLGENRVLIKDERIEVVYIPEFHRPFQYAKKYINIGRCLKDVVKGCDAAIIRLPSTIGQRVCKKVIRSKVPYALEVVYDPSSDWKRVKNPILKLILWKIHHDLGNSCKKANGVSYVTENYLQRLYPSNKNAFISNYTSLSLTRDFYGTPKHYPLHDHFVIAHVANQILFNGRKGHEQLIDAVRILYDKGVPITVKFAGENYLEGIEKLTNYAFKLGVENQIKFVGFLDRQQLSDYLEDADMFVLPTAAEGLPRVLIEAMAKGLPCITTDVAGNSELINRGFLFDYGDTNHIAELIEKLVKDKMLYEKTSLDNYQKSLKYEASLMEYRRDSFYSKLKKIVVSCQF